MIRLPVLHRRRNAFGKQARGLRAAFATAAAMGAMLRDDQGLGLGKIEDLAGAVPGSHGLGQRRTAMRAGLGIMINGGVGIGDLTQGLAFVALLPARLATRRLAQASRPGRLFQSVARRRLAAVRAVQAKPALQLRQPRHQSRNRGRMASLPRQ